MLDNPIVQNVLELVSKFGLKFLGAVAIAVIGLWVVRFLRRPLNKIISTTGLDETISQFLTSLISYALIALVGVAAITNLGVNTGSFVALLGAAGLAIGLAMEGSLANFAAGVLIAFFRPFKLGDWIEAADTEGCVDSISIFYTTLVTLDNETIIIPNSEITSGKVINFSAKEFVRVEVPLVIGYDVDFKTVKDLLLSVPEDCARVINEPVAEVQVTELAEEVIRLQLEVTTLPKDREDVVFEVSEAIKQSFEQAGIRPPHRKVDISVLSGALS